MTDVKRRYLNDQTFHAVVEWMRSILREAKLAPSEVREAAMLACIIEEEHKQIRLSDAEMRIVQQDLKEKMP